MNLFASDPLINSLACGSVAINTSETSGHVNICTRRKCCSALLPVRLPVALKACLIPRLGRNVNDHLSFFIKLTLFIGHFHWLTVFDASVKLPETASCCCCPFEIQICKLFIPLFEIIFRHMAEQAVCLDDSGINPSCLEIVTVKSIFIS